MKSTNFLGAVLTIAAGTAGQFIYDPLMLDDENVKRGYIDKTGTMIISIKNDYNSTFVDGTALVKVRAAGAALTARAPISSPQTTA